MILKPFYFREKLAEGAKGFSVAKIDCTVNAGNNNNNY